MKRRAPLHSSFLVLLPLGLGACQGKWSAEDVDGDGVSIADGDCWDRVEGPEGSGLSGADINPGATEQWYDGYDQDCLADDDYDADGDGFVLDAFVGATTYGIGGTGDLPGGDCWDDPNTVLDDYVAASGYPQLTATQVNPGVEDDTWYDDIDADCAGNNDFDQDGDGFESSTDPRADGSTGEDCDDVEAAINPDAIEVCDDVDNDCDNLVDGADDSVDPDSIRTWFEDQDDDGYGVDSEQLESCDQPGGYVEVGGDCADDDPDRNPSADEICNELDDDCNGTVDEAAVDAPEWYVDADLDGYGSEEDVLAACEQPDGFVDNPDDCNDGDPDVSPGHAELCATPGVDDDCDGTTDENDAEDAITWYSDLDEDDYGLGSLTTDACTEPTGFAAEPGDCDDTDASINPGADELCATVGVDDDCDGSADEADAVDGTTYYADNDEDGYGDPDSVGGSACEVPDGYVSNDGDCDDGCDACWTDAEEVCNDYVDNDCDGSANECAIDAIVDLATAELSITGETSGDDLALRMDSGDLDGDGQPDVLLGARSAGDGGRAYVVLGPITTTTAAADADLVLDGSASSDKAGRAVAMANLDGDAYDDVLVTATNAGDGNARGQAYVVYGPATGSLGLGSADWTIEASDNWTYLGLQLEDLGDITGDGDDDFGIGTTYDDVGGTNAGAVFVFSGDGSGTSDVNDDATAVLYGDSDSDGFSRDFSAAGDVDGDGVGDILVGAWQDDSSDSNAGTAYLFQGPLTGETSATDADAAWTGESSSDNAGDAVAGGGDLDGDGRVDLVIGAYTQGSLNAGAAYVVFGTASPSSGGLADADVIIRGDDEDQQLGVQVASLGDVDMDGVDDLAVGDGGRDSCSTDTGFGHTYVFYGTLSGDYLASDADAAITGADEGDCAGAQAAGPGDLSGDGYPDVLIGAPGAEGSGAAYIVPGVGM